MNDACFVASQTIEFGFPLLVTFTVARWVGNQFNKGLYETHIEARHIPFLEWDPPKWFRFVPMLQNTSHSKRSVALGSQLQTLSFGHVTTKLTLVPTIS